jgi:hypothetical protein
MTKHRTTHCRRGHKRTPENTYIEKTGGQRCLECRRVGPRTYCANGHRLTPENTYGKYDSCRLCAAKGAKGKTASATTRAKQSKALRGHTTSAATRAKISAAMKGKPQVKPLYRCGGCNLEATGRWLVPHQRDTGHTGRFPL